MQGVVALLALNCLESDKQHPHEWGSPEHLHALIECVRLGFADGLQHVADPQVCYPGVLQCVRVIAMHRAPAQVLSQSHCFMCAAYAAALSACTCSPSMCC